MSGQQVMKAASARAEARRKKGSGGVLPVSTGVWRVDVEVGRDPVTGRRRRVSRTVRGSREDAELALARLRVADHERRLQTGKTSARCVEAVLQQYLAAVESGTIEMAKSTVRTCRSAAATMIRTELSDGHQFGRIRLSRLAWQDIEDLYSSMRASGRGPDWVRRCATVLTQALEFGRKRGLIDTNPAKDANRPRSRRSKPFSPQAIEVRDLVAKASVVDPELGDAALILAATGMRRGEVLALRWGDVDLDRVEVTVEAALVDAGPGVGVVRKATKRSDWRDVPLTAGAAAAFKRQRVRRSEFLGSPPSAVSYVFCVDAAGVVPLRPDRLSDRWASARGMSPVTLQHLRHFAATTMLDAGESYRTVADILGNSENTLRLHYDGRTDVGKRRAISALELG